MQSFLEVRHNMEVAHRLYNLPGKCENIHGHSMWVTIRMYGELDANGILVNHYEKPLEFGEIKKAFRGHIDTNYDHRLLLNKNDPWAEARGQMSADDDLPGAVALDNDPTTEFLAMIIGSWAQGFFAVEQVHCTVQETHVNAAGVILGGE